MLISCSVSEVRNGEADAVRDNATANRLGGYNARNDKKLITT
jgi:hypothetical protein